MFTRKDRKIRNLKTMVANRDRLIKDMGEKMEGLQNQNADLRNENSELFNFRTKVIDIVKNEKAILNRDDKLKELVNKLEAEN